MEELELLNKIKEQLLDNGELYAFPHQPYKLIIHPKYWHEIFKTEEYNEKKKK
jgi:hypothetical protein